MTVKELSEILTHFSDEQQVVFRVDMSDQYAAQSMDRRQISYAGVEEKQVILSI